MNRLLVWLAVGLTVAGCTVRTHTAKTEEDSTQVAVRFAS